jgi:hypothetical protein
MRANRAGKGSEKPSGRTGPRSFPVAVWFAVACGLGGAIPGAGAAEVLRWKFRAGDTLRFSIEQKSNMSMRGMGTERKSARSQTVEMSWKVLRVDPGGVAEITQKIDRIRMRAEMPPLMPFDFDSAASKADQPGFEAETRQLRAEVGAEFTFRMKPTGEITDIKLSEQTLKGLRAALPQGGPEAEVSEQAIKETLLQSSPPSFPEGPLEPGKGWSAKPARMPLGFATLVMDRTFTYQGPDPKNPNLQLVGIDSSAKLEPMEGSDVKATIRNQEGKGSMTLDSQAGRVVSTRFGLKLDMAVTVMGQSIEQSTEMNTSMSLLP